MRIVLLTSSLLLAACGPKTVGNLETMTAGSTGSDATGTDSTNSTGAEPTTGGPATSEPASTTAADGDLPGETSGESVICPFPGGCHRLDVLLVVDTSFEMAAKQDVLAASVPHLVARLRGLTDRDGAPVDPDVNIMVTSTDVDFPVLCQLYKPGDYQHAIGAPVTTPCTERLDHFDWNNQSVPEVCTDHCPPGQAAAPLDPFVHFAGADDNVDDPDGIGDPVADALACLAPQGISGCGFEAPLEATRLALAPEAAWNQGAAPFLREDAALAVVLVTDETDCSAEENKYFDPNLHADPEFGKFWFVDPVSMKKYTATSAVCWNAGMACDAADMDGIHENCGPREQDALFDVSRYTDLLRDQLGAQGKPVFMLVLAGVPTVTAHNPELPHQPTAGGVLDLVHRDWTDADILPNDMDFAFEKQRELGIGPGCSNAAVGYATPPGRIRQVCEALDLADDPATPADESEVRCCIESVCDPDYSAAFDCLAGMLSQRLSAAR